MTQMSFGDAECAAKRKKTRRELFLEEMEQVVPWKSLLNLIGPFCPSAGNGRHPYPLEKMLRVHLMQNWFGLSDPAMEEALCEITPMHVFARLSTTAPIPDETTILNFRHLLEENELAPEILRSVNAHLTRIGLMLKRGSIVDATIIAAHGSTKNEAGARDPEMHRVKKGNQWHFGMKAHIGVDADSGLVHTVVTTAANESDVEQVDELLHGKEQVVHADAGYTGAQNHVRRKNIRCGIAAKRGRIKAMADSGEKRAIEANEKRKASVRAKVEHPFRVIKRQFGLMKVRFRGLAKNTAHVITLFALSNLWMARRRPMVMTGALRPQFAK